jgi:hypothetical protein
MRCSCPIIVPNTFSFSYTAQVRLPPEVIGATPDGIRANFYVIGGQVEISSAG